MKSISFIIKSLMILSYELDIIFSVFKYREGNEN